MENGSNPLLDKLVAIHNGELSTNVVHRDEFENVLSHDDVTSGIENVISRDDVTSGIERIESHFRRFAFLQL
jgi:hypothetical protein